MKAILFRERAALLIVFFNYYFKWLESLSRKRDGDNMAGAACIGILAAPVALILHCPTFNALLFTFFSPTLYNYLGLTEV